MKRVPSTTASAAGNVLPVQPVHRLLDHPDVRVAEFVLAPGQAGEWHRHSVVAEHCYALDGGLRVEVAGRAPVDLPAGQRCEFPAGQVHRLGNPGGQPVRYLVVQGPGVFDYQAVNGAF